MTSEPRERSAPTERRARERVGESEGKPLCSRLGRRVHQAKLLLDLDGQMIAVDVRLTAPRPTLSEARVLFPTGIVVNPRQDHYAVSSDGNRFLLRRQVVGGGRFPLTVVVNWMEELKQRDQTK